MSRGAAHVHPCSCIQSMRTAHPAKISQKSKIWNDLTCAISFDHTGGYAGKSNVTPAVQGTSPRSLSLPLRLLIVRTFNPSIQGQVKTRLGWIGKEMIMETSYVKHWRNATAVRHRILYERQGNMTMIRKECCLQRHLLSQQLRLLLQWPSLKVH